MLTPLLIFKIVGAVVILVFFLFLLKNIFKGMKKGFEGTYNFVIGDTLKDIPKKKLNKKHLVAVLLFIVSIVFTYFYSSSFLNNEGINIKELKQKTDAKMNKFDDRIKELKLNKKARDLAIPFYHIQNKTVKDYYITALAKDTIFGNKNKSFLLKKGQTIKVIELVNGKKYYYHSKQLLTKKEEIKK